MDDGQVLLPPRLAATFLETFDRELSLSGGTRIAGGKFKSVAKLVGGGAGSPCGGAPFLVGGHRVRDVPARRGRRRPFWPGAWRPDRRCLLA